MIMKVLINVVTLCDVDEKNSYIYFELIPPHIFHLPTTPILPFTHDRPFIWLTVHMTHHSYIHTYDLPFIWSTTHICAIRHGYILTIYNLVLILDTWAITHMYVFIYDPSFICPSIHMSDHSYIIGSGKHMSHYSYERLLI